MWAYREAQKLDDKIYFYKNNGDMEKRHFKNIEVTQLLQYALKNQRVIVECQPIFNIKNGETKAKKYEILMRILDGKRAIRYPGEFLDTANRYFCITH